MGEISRRGLITAGAALALTTFVKADATEVGTVTVDGVPIRFSRMGRGRPVCLLHGASGNLNDMTFRLAPALADRFEVVAFDRPGLGRSGAPPGGDVSISEQAELLRQALDVLGIERSIVVGHSYGGAVALAWAVDAPETVSGLVLLAAPSEIWPGGLGLTNQLLANPLAGPIVAGAASHLVTRGFADRALEGVFAPQPVPDGYLAHLDLALVLQPASLRENARQLVALKDELRPMIASYPSLPMPIELVHGEADRTVGLEIHSVTFVGQVPQARLTRLPGIGHMLHQVATREAADAIQRCDRRAERGAAL